MFDPARKLLVVLILAAAPISAGAMHSAQVTPQPSDASPLAFDVASIKPNTSGVSGITLETQPGGRLNVVNNPLSNIIRNAYNSIRPFVLQGGPDWIDSDRYDYRSES